MRGIHVDGLVVVTDHLGVLESLVLPCDPLLLQTALVGGLVVGPVEDDAGLAGIDGAVGDIHGGEVAGLLEFLEEIKAGLQVLDGAASQLVGHEIAVECGTGFGWLTVEGDGSGELGVKQIIERADITVFVGVPADGHDAGVIGDILAVGVFDGIGDVIPRLHFVRGEPVGVGGGDGKA